MPQPIVLSGYMQPNKVLLTRPAHAARIAAIAAEWTMVEQHLAALVAGAFGSSTRSEFGAFSISRNFIALVAVSEAETIRSKIKFIDASFGALVVGTRFEELWAKQRKIFTSALANATSWSMAIGQLVRSFPTTSYCSLPPGQR